MIERRLRTFAHPDSTLLYSIVALGLVGGGAIIWQAHTLARVIQGGFLGHRSLPFLLPVVLLIGFIALFRATLQWIGDILSSRYSMQVRHRLRSAFFAHVFALGPLHARGERSGELAATGVNGIDDLDEYFGQYQPQTYLSILIPVLIAGVAFCFDPLSAGILLATAPVIPIFMVLIGLIAKRVTDRQWQKLSLMSAHFLDVLQGLTTLKIFGRSQRQTQIIARISDDFRQTTMGVLRMAFLSSLALELIATLSTAVVAVEIGLRLLYGQMTFFNAFFVLLLAPEFYAPLRTLGAKHHAAMTGRAAAERVFAVLDTPTPGEPPDVVTDWGGEIGTLTLRDVSFQHAGAETATLRHISLTLRAGETVALIGPSGAGKSTLAHLLLGFARPTSGQILANGVDIARLAPAAWRDAVAWVPARPYLFNTTIRANIAMARPDATDEEVMIAARKAQAHDFIMAMPEGYHTPVGEQGARLSGGQLQRIALARAFLRDARLVILDEATAHLDTEQEQLVRVALQELLRGRTALVIAHRLETADLASRILVMEDCTIVADGTAAGLQATSPLYRDLMAVYGGVA